MITSIYNPEYVFKVRNCTIYVFLNGWFLDVNKQLIRMNTTALMYLLNDIYLNDYTITPNNHKALITSLKYAL
jgi:hypothetical protein